jgi:hypothetical protein
MESLKMKIYLKIFVALALIAVALFWAVDSVRSRSYAGADLNIVVGRGAVTVTNPDDVPVPVQLVSTGTRNFSIVSTIAGVTGSSTTQGTGREATQLFEFAPPAGESQFTVTRGGSVSFIANTPTNLEVNVQPLSEGDARTTIIIAAVVVLGALFYISKTTEHRWIARLRGMVPSSPVPKVAVATAAAGQGQPMRAYGDNRADISEK